ncbi:hypothetical protein LTR36_003862 [Oleoguttula mirabilis]|uniref:Uncharacterized protein n=1 Tax=Oleoguttula mirabilis TaxID=1507867 RepID=A0AAV9JHS9_9PEZI|nr:hypothetical protein LTR36_003862 [Oleoguttula mirabilis]
MDLSIGRGRGPRPPSRLPTELSSVLLALEKLEKLTFVLPEYHTQRFRKAFEGLAVSLRTVRSLVLGPHTEWIVAMCPNVASISTHEGRWLHSNVDGDHQHRHDYDLIRAAGQAKKLQHFEVRTWWRHDLFNAMLAATPKNGMVAAMAQIPSIGLPRGTLRGGGVPKTLGLLARFPNLRRLVVHQAADLAYLEHKVAHNWPNDDVETHRGGRQEAAAESLFTQCAHLCELWVGTQTKAIPSRFEDGTVDEVFWSFGHALDLRDGSVPGSRVRMAERQKSPLQTRETKVYEDVGGRLRTVMVQVPISNVHHVYTKIGES